MKPTELGNFLRALGALLVIVGGLGYIGNHDYAHQLELEGEERLARIGRVLDAHAAERAERYARVLAACANGRSIRIGFDTVISCHPTHVAPWRPRPAPEVSPL